MMNVYCIHSVPFDKSCDLCDRTIESGSEITADEIALEMLWEKILIKRSYEDAKILMKLTTLKTISALTGVPQYRLRKMQRHLEGGLCKSEMSTLKNN